MEIPRPEPDKLLQWWMEWERGEVTPGRVMANLKTGGLRNLLEELSSGQSSEAARPAAGPASQAPDASASGAQSWVPTV